MAVVKMGQIKSTPAKALAYISRPDATSDGVWVSTNAETIFDPSDFKAVARQFASTVESVAVTQPRAGSVLAHHIIQSFDPKDGVDAAMAHRIGVQLAEQFTGGDHEYMIATHLDKGHVHNHIIVNSVNRVSGRKLRVQKDTIGQIRDLSDALCRANGLSVLPKPERATGRSMADTYRVLKGESAKQFIRTEIDKAAVNARDWASFEAALARVGIETLVRGGRNGTVSFRELSMGRAVRDYRLGAAYTESSIMARLTRQVVNQIGIDVSMVTKETRDTLTVIVPGTKRELHLTVAKTQVIRRGRALRLYVPANDDHLLSDRAGTLARTVRTDELYQWFSRPGLEAVKGKQGESGLSSQWSARMADLRELEASVNAKSRWMQSPDSSADGAVEQAAMFVRDRQFAYQTALVALTEQLDGTPASTTTIDVLRAELRHIEREIDSARGDIQALSKMTKEETRMSVSDRITSRSGHSESAGEDARVQQANRRDELGADALTEDDAAQDRDGGTRSMSVQERLQAQAEQLRENREQGAKDDRGRSDNGRNR